MRTVDRLVGVLVLLVTSLSLAAAQKAETAQPSQMPPSLPIISAAELESKVPAPKPDDVKSIDAIMHAAYDSISGPAGARDWNRFRSLFLPQARFTQVGKGSRRIDLHHLLERRGIHSRRYAGVCERSVLRKCDCEQARLLRRHDAGS